MCDCIIMQKAVAVWGRLGECTAENKHIDVICNRGCFFFILSTLKEQTICSRTTQQLSRLATYIMWIKFQT